MQWTVRLEARTSAGEVKTTDLVTFSRPGVVSTLAGVGLMLSETKTLLAKLQESMLCDQVAAYAAHHRVCAACGVLQPLKDRRTRRLQTLRNLSTTLRHVSVQFRLVGPAWVWGGLIQAAVGLWGGMGGCLTKRSGCAAKARSRVACRAAWMALA